MPEFELHGPTPEREAQELMPKADTENRFAGLEQLAHIGHDLLERLWIPRPVGEHDAVDLEV